MSERSMVAFACGVLVGGAISGCGDKSLLSLSASIEEPMVTVESATLGTKLAGSFELVLMLGTHANDATEVSLEVFSLVSADTGRLLVSPLEVRSATTPFPVTVAKGEEVRFTLNLGDDAGLLDASVREDVCSGKVRIEGAVADSLTEEVTSVASESLVPDCG